METKLTPAERAKEYRQKYPERSRESTRKWKSKNLEKMRDYARERARIWRQENPEKHRENNKKYLLNPISRAKADRRNKDWRLKKKYGINLLQYEEMFKSQGGRCAIPSCGGKAEHLDHCHTEGTVRGILCKSCNMTLGSVKDSIAILNDMIAYLEKSKSCLKLNMDCQEK